MLMCPSAFLFTLKLGVESLSSEKNNRGMELEEIPKWPCRHQCGGLAAISRRVMGEEMHAKVRTGWKLFFFLSGFTGTH